MKKRNIAVMYMISLFQGMVFYASISTLYRTARGLTLSQYAFIDSVSLLLTLLLEVPWGVVADKIGYRKTLLLANGFYALSKLVFLNAYGFLGFLMERVFFSLAMSGISGVEMSVLYLSCDEGESQKVFGRYSAFGNRGMLLSAGIFAICALTHQQAALFTLIAYSISLALTFLVTEVKEETKEETDRIPFKLLLKNTVTDIELIVFLASCALISVSTWVIVVFLNQNQYLANGRNERFIGFTFIISGLINFIGVFSDNFTRKTGDKLAGIILLGCLGVTAMLLSFSKNVYLSLFLIASTDALYNLFIPLQHRLESDYIKAKDRATVLSIYMMCIDLFSVVPNTLMGISGENSLPATFRWCALMSFAAMAGYIYFINRKQEK